MDEVRLTESPVPLFVRRVDADHFPGVMTSALRTKLEKARDEGKLSITAQYRRDCPVCGGTACMDQTGALSTGLDLGYYQPAFGEVLKNTWMECDDCGFEQES